MQLDGETVTKPKRRRNKKKVAEPVKVEISAKASKWRLKRTLKRRLEFRPIDLGDMKYVWAAYRKGALASMGEQWAKTDMPAADFDNAFKIEVIKNYSSCWTLFAETGKGFLPVGLVLAFWSHPNPRLAPFQIIGDLIWFSWASRRNKIESAVNFFSKVRKDFPLVEYAQGETTKRFFEVMCQHGVMRRVGTSFVVFRGEATAVFETRRS